VPEESELPRKARWLPVIALVLFVGLSSGTLLLKRVVPNEGWFADTGWHLWTQGALRTTILESKGTWLAGIEQHTYWILPVYPLVQAGWYRIAGFSVRSLRALSVCCGIAVLAAWFLILRALGGALPALLGTLILATDYELTLMGAIGRMDMMCAAFGFGGIAAYLTLRERRLGTAVVLSHVLAALACFTHPCGILPMLGLAAVTLYLDRDRLRMRLVLLAALPYLLLGAAYGIYIMQAPADFLRQFGGNISGLGGEITDITRFGGLKAPWTAVKREFMERWVTSFSLGGQWSVYQVRILVLIVYFGAVVVALIDRTLRARREIRALLLMAGISVFVLCFLEGLKMHYYLVHVVPVLAALAIFWMLEWTSERRSWRPWLVGAFMAAQAASTVAMLWEDSYHTEYLPAVDYLRAHAGPGELIMGSGELGFAFGFEGQVKDDVRLGYYSGRRPRYYVTSFWYLDWIDTAKRLEPLVYRHIQTELSAHYHEVFRNRGYTIYERW